MQNIVPIKIYEYMAAGKPIIATNLNGITKEFGYGAGITYVEGPTLVLDTAYKLVQEKSLLRLKQETLNYVKNNDWDTIVIYYEKYMTESLFHTFNTT